MRWRARFCDNSVPFHVVVEQDALAREVLRHFCSLFVVELDI